MRDFLYYVYSPLNFQSTMDKKNKETEQLKLPTITEEEKAEEKTTEKMEGESTRDEDDKEMNEFFAIVRRIQLARSTSVGLTIPGHGAAAAVSGSLTWKPVFRPEDFGEKKVTNAKKRPWIDLNELPDSSAAGSTSSSNSKQLS